MIKFLFKNKIGVAKNNLIFEFFRINFYIFHFPIKFLKIVSPNRSLKSHLLIKNYWSY